MTILCYHSIDPIWRSPLAIRPEAFAEHCEWLAANRRVLPLTEAVRMIDRAGRLPRGAVVLTFDDGFAGVYHHALPVLSRLRLPATVFVVAGTLAPDPIPVDWVDTPPPFQLHTLTRQQVVEMEASGVSVASHGYSHRDLTALSDEEGERDLLDSRDLLSGLLGRPVPFLAYPRGKHDARVRRTAERAGFTHAFSLPEAREPVARLCIPRVGVYPDNGVGALRMKTTQWYLRFRMSPIYPVARGLLSRTKPSAERRVSAPLEQGRRESPERTP
jgi:peptidoglycan/xylan/chitin deacetylase (PgdA/CDA1 family)